MQKFHIGWLCLKTRSHAGRLCFRSGCLLQTVLFRRPKVILDAVQGMRLVQ